MSDDEQGAVSADIRRRWDTDTRGAGIGDGQWIAPAVRQVLEVLAAPGSVAEEPDVHLLQHLRRACDAPSSPWRLMGAELWEAVYVVTLEWRRSEPRFRQLRADAFALIRTVAEGSTFVKQRLADGAIEYHVTTGMIEGDSPFATHGHLLLLRIGGPQIPRLLSTTT